MPKLYVVATPIGNLNDLTPRMESALREADLIAAEDTRVTMKLLSRFGLKKPMVSCHRHNEEDKTPELIARMLEENLVVALTCDAGTPGISDPGHLLVRAAWDAGIPVVPVSGPSAVATALSACGFDAREFVFYGFLPREKKDLREKLAAVHASGIPVAVLYESPHRIVALTEEICRVLPESKLCVCCDLTKKFESILRGNCQAVLETLRNNPNVEKGEYCVVVDLSAMPPRQTENSARPDAPAYVLQKMLEGLDIRDACDSAAMEGYARNDVYRAKIQIRNFLERLAEE